MPRFCSAAISTTIVSPPRLRHELVLGQLGEDPLRGRLLLVDLVDGHDDRHLGGACVV